MSFNGLIKGALPVIVGVFAAGLIMNALRDNAFVKNAIDGFDS